MATILDELVGRIEDPDLRQELATHVARLQSTREYGLVFPAHLPERVRLPNHPVRRRTVVTLRDGTSQDTWVVKRVSKGQAYLLDADGTETTAPITDLIVVRRFGEPVYPGLSSVGTVAHGGDKPWHAVINAENYHALETLLYAYEEKVDCIYIDPPYNSGAKDWKYNNDFVDSNDSFRHSKWLSFMERRLHLAKRLLAPDGVLVVTIDEKEVHHLGMLLEQMFPDTVRQMVTSVINTKGVARGREFARVEEYLFFVFCGDARPAQTLDNMLTAETAEPTSETIWLSMLRRGSDARREDRPNQFYPIFVDEAKGVVHSVGQSLLPVTAARDTVKPPKGTVAVWPLRTDGTEGRWQIGRDAFVSALAEGTARLGRYNKKSKQWAVNYLNEGAKKRIAAGELVVTGKDAKGALVIAPTDASDKSKAARTVWNRPSHDASTYGSTLLRALLPGRKFPFPKSLYAVRDTLRFAVKDKPDALVLDFFGGSGTTAHAVMLLNQEDDGQRRSIVVTNNEVSPEEAASLSAGGHTPGSEDWERLGIARFITWPRIQAAVTGKTHDGAPIKGSYKFPEDIPMADGLAENVEFFELTYLDRDEVERGQAFAAIAPLLWMQAGGKGERIEKEAPDYAISESAGYAVLFDVGAWSGLAAQLDATDTIKHVFVITDSLAQYQQIVAELPPDIQTRQLYSDYLANFELNTGGAS